MPTFDIGAFLQRISQIIIKGLILHAIIRVLGILYDVFKTPAALTAIVLMLTYEPDKVQWILQTIGQLELKAFTIVLAGLVPELFGGISAETASWATIWNTGLSALPSDIVDIMNAVGVAELLGLITSTLTAGSMVLLYRKVFTRLGI